MAYVEAHASLREHPKTKKLARLLNISRAATIGHMLCLWWWCQEYAEDGDLSSYEFEDIADAADWDGDASVLVDAMLSCGMKGKSGFLARNDDGTLFVKDWHEYGGKLSIKRQQARERMRKMRDSDAPVTRNTRVTGANVTQDVTHPLRNVTVIDQTRVDQIRSDKIRQEDTEQNANENTSDCLSDCLSGAMHLLQKHNINATQYRIEQCAQAIEDYGLSIVQEAFAVSANKDKETDWNYVRGVAKRMAKPAPVNGNGKPIIANVPEDVI